MGLRKYSQTFLMGHSATDTRQVPAAGATVEVYRQGAKVVANVPVLITATLVNVRSTGGILVADTLQAGTDTTRRFTVTEVTSATSLTMTAVGGSTIQLLANERLVPIITPPTLYDNDASTGTPLTNPATADSNGYIEFYTPTSPFDLIVRLSGMSPDIYEDQESGVFSAAVNKRPPYYNALDYSDVATALAEVPAGRRLFFPAEGGPYIPPTAAGWTISKPVEIFSDGPSIGEDKGFQPFGLDKNSVIFVLSTAATRDICFRDLVMSNASGIPAASGLGDHIRFIGAGDLTNVVIDRCWLLYAGRSGFFSGNDAVTASLVGLSISRSRVYGCGGHGILVYGGHLISITDMSASTVNQGMGCVLVNCGNGIVVQGSDFESNGDRLAGAGAGTLAASTMPFDYSVVYNGQLYLEDCKGGTLLGNNIEDISTTVSKNGITLNHCRGTQVAGNHLTNASSIAGTVGVKLVGGTIACSIQPNDIDNMAASVAIASLTDEIGNVILPQSVRTADATAPGTVSIPAGVNRNFIFATNTVASVNDNKGMGLIFPMMASASLPATLQEGMIFYEDTSDQVRVRKAAATAVVP